MQADGGGFAAEGPTKRTRRPSVRLHEPYYEIPLAGHRKPVQRQSDGPRKPSIAKAKNSKKGGDDASGRGQGEDIEFDDNDDVAIGKWKSFNVSNRNKDFKRKRASPSVSKKSSSGNGKQEEEEDDDINSKFVVEDTNPTSPSNPLLGSDDENDNDNLSHGNNKNNNVGMNLQRGLKNKNGDGVRAWLKELGLDKYALLFEVHEVDDDVLEKLTLEDLKDMGINAVGTRRKMYASIQKLGKGVS